MIGTRQTLHSAPEPLLFLDRSDAVVRFARFTSTKGPRGVIRAQKAVPSQ